MESIIRKLLNYDFDNISYVQRLKLCKEFLRLCECKIPEKTTYNQPKLHLKLDEFNNVINPYSINDVITLDQYSFSSNNGLKLATSLADIAHECCHGAQQQHISFNCAKRNISNLFNIDPERYFELYAKYENDYMNDVNKKQTSFEQLLNKSKIDTDLQNIEMYLKGFYWFHPIEREADNFAFSLVDELIAFAKTLELSDSEKERLDIISEGLRQHVEKTNTNLSIMSGYRDNDAIRQEIIESIEKTRREECRKRRNVFEYYERIEDQALLIELNSAIVNLHSLILGLELSYDDSFAHKIFNAVFNNYKLGEIKNTLIYVLTGYTNITLTPEEERKFREVLNNFKGTSLTFDSFMSEKMRVRKYLDSYLKINSPTSETSPESVKSH